MLLSGAIQAAQEAADLPLSFQAADAMAKDFPIDSTALKAQSMLKLSQRQFTTNRAENQRAGLELLDELEKSGDLAQAERVGTVLEQSSANGSDRAAIQQRVRSIHEKHIALNRVEQAMLVLKTSPDDPAANLAVGRCYCMVQGDWTRGLPMLAKGSDATMKTLALRDLGATRAAGTDGPASHDAETVGDAWWDASGRETTPIWKAAMQQRAVVWYRQALHNAGGLERLKIEKRIETIPVSGSHVINTARAPEADAVVAEVAAHYPNAIKGVGALELVRTHDGRELHGGVPCDATGSFSKNSKLVEGGGIGLANIYEPWPAGKYLIVYRVRVSYPPTSPLQGNDICFLDVCHDSGNTIAADHPNANEFRFNQWSSIPIPLELPKDDTIEYRLWPNNHTVIVDRIYIFRMK